jgi:hypothetical protein
MGEFFGKPVCRMSHHYIIIDVLINGLLAVPAESDFRHIGPSIMLPCVTAGSAIENVPP